MPQGADGPALEAVQDGRRPPFCYQTHDALDAIRAHWRDDAKPYGQLSTALAVYLVLTEAANRNGGAQARGGFTAARKAIAEAVGVSADTLDRYVKELVAAAVLEVVREKAGDVNLPNEWRLVEPDAAATPSRVGAARGGRVGAAVVLRPRTEAKKLVAANAAPSAAAAPAPKPRPRNLPFDALCEIDAGADPAIDGGRVAKALAVIRKRLAAEARRTDAAGERARALLDADAQGLPDNRDLASEIHRRADLYRERWPEVELTVKSLGDNFTRLLAPQQRAGRADPADIATMFDR